MRTCRESKAGGNEYYTLLDLAAKLRLIGEKISFDTAEY